MTRRIAVAVSCALVAALAWLPTAAEPKPAKAPKPCGLTTLDATIEVGEDGLLKCGPGQRTLLRQDLVAARAKRVTQRRPLTTFLTIADVQLADEESPARAEWADKCTHQPFDSAFRTQETMVPHLLEAHIRAANAIARKGTPILKVPVEFAVGLGDLADNQQYNEVRWIIDLFDGGKLLDPDSGEDGYDGVQGADPTGADGTLVSPLDGETILDLANEPFWAAGLNRKGKRLPWYALPGNHDVKVQGTAPDDNPAWRAFIRAYVVGPLKVMDIAPDYQQAICSDPSVLSDPDFLMKVLTSPGTTKVVPADENRRMLDRAEWAAEFKDTTGIPAGHGYLPDRGRCRSEDGDPLERACYSFDRGLFHYIAVDSNPAEGEATGAIDEAQFQWIERELIANSRSYFDAEGELVGNKKGRNRLIVLMTHHTIESTDNEIAIAQGQHGGEDLAALLLRFPNMILQVDGHTHQNKIWAHQNEELGTGYWEVNTASIADYPTQSRIIEIADNRDGTLSIFATIFDAAVPPNARAIDWKKHDHTDEVALGGAERAINEDWLASAGREVQYYDPQQDLTKIGEPEDRNVELVIKRPFKLPAKNKTARGTTTLLPRETGGPPAGGLMAMLALVTALALLAARPGRRHATA